MIDAEALTTVAESVREHLYDLADREDLSDGEIIVVADSLAERAREDYLR
ncbi:hypothetical protein [Halomarina oriensis]|uniref:Uncharacterized protein n=1 Tax=Halomarina oriensis TaxID=671145 RepID=A0A6B0GPX8_9EURY|nr:hypothetical protein [Halomarina oriensis]MWG36946.1 hypothetical protein [Halomarina oriensis]